MVFIKTIIFFYKSRGNEKFSGDPKNLKTEIID